MPSRRRQEWQGRNKGSAYIRWYSGDILSDGFVAGLSPIEENCYRRLLDFNARDGFLPDVLDRLAMMCKLTSIEFSTIWDVLVVKFPLTPKNGKTRTNSRIKFELDRQKRRSLSASERGKRGGRPLKDNKGKGLQNNLQQSYSLPSVKLKQSDPDPDPDPEVIGDSKKDLDRSSQGSFLKDGRSGSSTKPDEPTTSRFQRVKWDKKAMKLNSSEEYKREFLATWDREFSREEIGQEVLNATRWLSKNPNRRGSKSRLGLFLHNWMKRALEDRVAREENEAITSRPIPVEEPKRKRCPKCREEFPDHAGWCNVNDEKGDDDEGNDQNGG